MQAVWNIVVQKDRQWTESEPTAIHTSFNNDIKVPYFFLYFDVDRGGPIIADTVFSSMLAASKGSTNDDRHTAAAVAAI